MNELNRMIAEVRHSRAEYHSAGQRIEAAACAIRERALLDAKRAIETERAC
jgi:hypothetical protein